MSDPKERGGRNPEADDHGAGGFREGFQSKGVYCNRLEHLLPVDEHAGCAYCHGAVKDIETGEHERFCGFDPTKDPIHFGFPGDSTRDIEG